MVSIPKIIHQIWIQGYREMPLRYRLQAQSWQKQNPTWEYRLWDEDSLVTLIRQHSGELLRVFEAYESCVARSDIGRYVVLHTFGGLYVDVDTVCVRSLNPYLNERNVSLYIQVYDNPIWSVTQEDLVDNVSNAFIACTPGHDFWSFVFRHLLEAEHPQFFWILATGPEMFIACLKRYLADHKDVFFFTRKQIVSAYYISRHYLRWYAWKNRDVFAIHYNDSARSEWHPSIRSWLWPKS